MDSAMDDGDGGDDGDDGDTGNWKDGGDDCDYSDDFHISIIETARAAATPPLGRGGTCLILMAAAY